MPAPVVPWVTGTPISAKSLDLALYTADGTADNPNGIAFHAQRPILAEAYSRTATFPGASGGTQSVMSTSGSVSTSFMVIDTAGYFGQSQDQPGAGYYQFQPVINGSAGDGATAGGWTLLAHFPPLKPTATQTSVSADLTGLSQTPVSGTRQAPSGTLDSCPFFLDLVNTGATIAWQPAVTIRDSAGTTTTNAVNATDPSGETPRFYAVWAAASATTTGQAVFSVNGAYPFTAPAGVSSVTVTAFGAGGGGGGGDASGGGVEYGGGGGGGAEFAQGVVGVTGGNNYTVVVGAGGIGGTGGTAPTLATAGGNSVFAGDTANVTAHGGGAGGVASGSGDGTGGSGGSGSGATTHHSGGGGAAGGTAAYGGGGGSSAGPAVAGNNAVGAAGAAAPSGGGPGGSGGSVAVSVVQTKSGTTTGSNTNGYALNFANAIQAGNTVVVAYNYQGKPSAVNGSFPDPTLTLSDGTVTSDSLITADNTNISTNMQAGVGYFFSVSGGQTGILFTGHASTAQSDLRAVCIQMWEVTGLGPSPNLDVSGTGTTTMGGSGDIDFYPPSGTSIPTSNDAPEFWVGLGAGQQNTGFTTYAPASSEGWTCFPSNTVTKNGITSSLLAGYQIATTTGQVKYGAGSSSKGGGFSKKVSVGWVVAAFTTSAVTNGATPITGPGGGGGGGLGTSGNGGNGFDGQVTLTWTGVSGGSYGNPPLPAPFSGWADDTTVGVTAGVDVNLNSTAGIQPVCNFLSSPPILRATTTSGQSIASSVNGGVAVSFTGTASTVTVDSYSGWTVSNYGPPVRALAGPAQAKAQGAGRGIGGHAGGARRRAVRAALRGALKGGAVTSAPTQPPFTPPAPGVPYYVVQRTGLYLFHGLVAFAASSAGRRQCGAVINGTTYWGPPANPATSGTTNVAKTQVFSLQAGDIVQLCAYQTTGSPLALATTDQTRFLLVFLCEEGSPASTWTPPDITFRWTSGMSPAQLPGLLQTHLGNDLGFLVNRPYLLAYQTVAQSGLTVGAFSTVTMDTVGGIVHNTDVGDNYNGWSSSAYVAPVAGWYLVVEEVFATAAAAATATVTAGILPSTSGGVAPSQTPDFYQAQTATTAATFGGGAAAITLQYCSVGESITPQIMGAGYAGAYGTLVGTGNGGIRASSLAIIWISE